MTRCSSCGATEFELLLSGKYRCIHCGSHQVPSEIRAHLVEVKTPFWSENIFKKNPLLWVFVAVGVCLISYLGITYFSARNQLKKVIAQHNELKTQQQRSGDILKQSKILLQEKYALNIEETKIEKIIASLSQMEDDKTALRLLDDLSGSLNREIVARRNYQAVYLEFKKNSNWMAKYLGRNENFTDVDPDSHKTLKQRK